MTRRWPLIGVALAVLWLFVRGVRLDPVNVAEELIIGLGVGVPIAFALRRMYASDLALAGTVRVVPYAGLYVLFFLYELITANLEVAYRVLAPSMPIDPTVVEVPLRVESPAAITTIANSITLTPGTLTMDYDPEYNALYVHALTGADDPQGVVDPIRRWEDYALVVFDERRGPGDPVPQVPGPDHHLDGRRGAGPDPDRRAGGDGPAGDGDDAGGEEGYRPPAERRPDGGPTGDGDDRGEGRDAGRRDGSDAAPDAGDGDGTDRDAGDGDGTDRDRTGDERRD